MYMTTDTNDAQDWVRFFWFLLQLNPLQISVPKNFDISIVLVPAAVIIWWLSANRSGKHFKLDFALLHSYSAKYIIIIIIVYKGRFLC